MYIHKKVFLCLVWLATVTANSTSCVFPNPMKKEKLQSGWQDQTNFSCNHVHCHNTVHNLTKLFSSTTPSLSLSEHDK